MTWERLLEQSFKHTDGTTVKIISDNHIEYAEAGRRRVAVVGFGTSSPLRFRIFAGELTPWILPSTEQQPMSDADRTTVLNRIAEAFGSGRYDVVIVTP